MKKVYYLFVAAACIMLVFSLPQSAAAKKNILLLVADDMGTDAMRLYTDQLDLTPDQREDVPPTPTIDSLAAEGVTFNNAWAYAQCTPTRGTLITGRYGFRTGITRVVGVDLGNVELDVNDPELLPRLLKEKGYATALIGKWHMTVNDTGESDANDDPNEAGFDYWAGFLEGGLAGFLGAPDQYFGWPQVINGSGEVIQNHFATSENVDRAIEFIDEKVPDGKPWFLSLNFAAPHWDYDTPPKGLVDPEVVAQVEATVRVIEGNGWNYVENYLAPAGPGEDRLRIRRAVFNALISAMDTEIKRLLESVDLDNTCIIFIGDNGTQGPPNPRNVVVPPFDPFKAKSTVYEGGIRVPMVVYDPGIKNPGRFTDALVSTVDIYAMILKIAGCPSPNRFDGKHFKAVLQAPNNNVSVRNFIFAEFEDIPGLNVSQAIRNDRYKVIFNNGVPEFYDLGEDRFEGNNLLLGNLSNKEKSNYDWLLNKLENLLSSKK
jgi:arylsulfatase A-like enzyme